MSSIKRKPHRMLPGLLGAVMVTVTASASAQTFAPVQPTACASGWSSMVPWTYRMGYVRNHGDPTTERSNIPLNKNKVCPNGDYCDYIPNVHQTRTFVANQWVNQVRFNVKMLRTEPGSDFFDVRFPGRAKSFVPFSGDQTPGEPPAGFGLFVPNVPAGSFQSRPLSLIFHSDSNDVTDRGVDIDGVQVCSNGQASGAPAPLVPFQRTTGVLLDTNDTVYMSLPASTDPAIHTALALQGQPNTNVDLYVSCNALPTPNNSFARRVSPTPQEFLHLVDSDCAGTWFVAVHSAAGKGWFNVIPSRHFATSHKTLRAGVAYDASAATGTGELADIEKNLKEMARRWYAATEGTDWIDVVTLHNDVPCVEQTGNFCGGAYCNICITNWDWGKGTDYATCELDPYNAAMHIVTRKGAESGDVLAHELGHCQWRWALPPLVDIHDEYVGGGLGTVFTCAHSIMGATSGDNSNFCSALDHGRDGTPGAYGGPQSSVWDVAFSHTGTVPWKPTETPDNYNYVDFDFNSPLGYGWVLVFP